MNSLRAVFRRSLRLHLNQIRNSHFLSWHKICYYLRLFRIKLARYPCILSWIFSFLKISFIHQFPSRRSSHQWLLDRMVSLLSKLIKSRPFKLTLQNLPILRILKVRKKKSIFKNLKIQMELIKMKLLTQNNQDKLLI